MENKKALVIIPPYSEPLKKLGEILSTPEEAAAIDIYVLEDLKEAGQLIPTLGQCLIVIANAKKCALFLQENRWAISKNHSKVILMTPKEIPQKTLMKFLKIGLTEVILETLPPKSLLYKIKLLLRSVKGQENKKEETINVKSMLDMAQVKNANEQQRIEKGIIADSASAEEKTNDEKKMFEEEDNESLDYLKAKKKQQQDENVIDTHWKSKRNDNHLELEDGDESEKKKKEAEEISTHYKNERSNNLDLDFVNNDNMKGKGSKAEDESEFSIEKLKQSALSEIELEDSSRNKKDRVQHEADDDEDIYAVEKKEQTIMLEDTVEKSSQSTEESIVSKKDRSQKAETTLELEKEKKTDEEENLNHIDSYYKGKLQKNETILEIDEEEYTDKKIQENEKEEEKEKNKTKEESGFALEDSDQYKNQEDLSDTEAYKNAKQKALQDELDDDAYMRGKLSPNTQLDLAAGENDKKHSALINDESQRERKTEKMLSEEDDSDTYNKNQATFDADLDKSDKENTADLEEFNDDESLQQKLAREMDLEFETSHDSDKETKDNEDGQNKANKLQRLALSEEREFSHERESQQRDEEENPQLRKLKNTQFELENGERHNESNANVEHLDKYMRSRSSKSEDQNWDLGNKKKDTTFALEKGKAGQVDLNLLPQFKDAGEQTIDYRKLKEEFELLKEGANLPPDELEKLRKMIRGETEEDDSSHRVYVPEPKGVDFLMDMAIDLYDPSIKPRELFEKIAKKIHAQKGYATFLMYSKPNDVKEAFTIFQLTEANLISDELRARFLEMKKDGDFFKSQAGYSLANWRCGEILDKNNKPWEDTELPSWATNELQNKAVEYIYPMFDGLDRMGHIYIWFPEGIKYEEAKFLDMILEASRSLYLDQIIRSSKNNNNRADDENTDDGSNDGKKGGLLSGITSLFGKKKTG